MNRYGKKTNSFIKKIVFLSTFVALSSVVTLSVHAEEMTDTKPVGIMYQNSIAEKALSKKLANPEPEEFVVERNRVQKEKEEKANLIAKEEAKRLTEERHLNWVNSFPSVDETSTQGKFLNSIANDAVAIAQDAGTYPSVMMAQAGLESDWGRSGLSANYNNLFGVKGAYGGKTANLKTKEDTGSGMITIKSGFRVYPSTKESLLDYGELMKNGLKGNPTFYSGTWKSKAPSYKEATSYLQGRYATDTQYAVKLNKIIEDFGLNRFDEVEKEDLTEIVVKPEIEPEEPLKKGRYLTKATDSLSSIAASFDLTEGQLMKLNELTDPFVYVNQELIVEKTPEMQVEETFSRGLANKHISEKRVIDALNQ